MHCSYSLCISKGHVSIVCCDNTQGLLRTMYDANQSGHLQEKRGQQLGVRLRCVRDLLRCCFAYRRCGSSCTTRSILSGPHASHAAWSTLLVGLKAQ